MSQQKKGTHTILLILLLLLFFCMHVILLLFVTNKFLNFPQQSFKHKALIDHRIT